MSSLGKGITASSIGVLLRKHGLKVFMQKFDPYLNYNPSTMSPMQHGEVFVTEDGAETDLDLGHYERFIDENLTKESSVTSGKIYASIIDNERKGKFKGATVQVVPHVTDEIKNRIELAAKKSNADVIITEIGGTVGDIESLPFIEAIRQFRIDKGYDNVIFIHNTLVPFLKVSEEIKTKPTQHSVKELQGFGIQPDAICLRSEVKINNDVKSKVSMFCNVPNEAVFEALDQKIVYSIILAFEAQKLDQFILKRLRIEEKYNEQIDLSDWKQLINNIKLSKKIVNIALVGKYVSLHDAYLSLIEALKHAGTTLNYKVNIIWIDSTSITNSNIDETLSNVDGIVVPDGDFDSLIDNKLLVFKYARENNIPLFGICFGFQLAIIEYVKNVLHMKLDDDKDLQINSLNNIRLGSYECTLDKESLAYECYNLNNIKERHRNRFEFNNKYEYLFNNIEAIFSGINVETGFKEIFEITSNKFYLCTQFHPEFISRPLRPHPLFLRFIKETIKKYE